MENVDPSTDQQYLYNIYKAVASGNCCSDFALQKPGPVCHSRWLTTANRLLRLYVATQNPTENLVTLATYVMEVYAPVWFHIKTKSECTEDSRHLWRMIKYSRYLQQQFRDIIDPVIQRNGYFGHAENILMAMLTDKKIHIRELAYRRILAARIANQTPSGSIRKFRVPSLNFHAEDYTDLVEWQAIDRYEPPPPLMKHLSNDEAAACVRTNDSAHVRRTCHCTVAMSHPRHRTLHSSCNGSIYSSMRRSCKRWFYSCKNFVKKKNENLQH